MQCSRLRELHLHVRSCCNSQVTKSLHAAWDDTQCNLKAERLSLRHSRMVQLADLQSSGNAKRATEAMIHEVTIEARLA